MAAVRRRWRLPAAPMVVGARLEASPDRRPGRAAILERRRAESHPVRPCRGHPGRRPGPAHQLFRGRGLRGLGRGPVAYRTRVGEGVRVGPAAGRAPTLSVGRRGTVAGLRQPRRRCAASGTRRRVSRRRIGLRRRADARRRLGVDQLGAGAVAGIHPDDLPALLRAVLRRRLQGIGGWRMGSRVGHCAAQLPKLGSPLPAADLLRRPAGMVRRRRRGGSPLMCRHLGWLGREASVASLVLDPPHGLRVQSYAPRRQKHGLMNADGWGVGFFDGATPRRWRSAAPLWGDVSFDSIAPALRSHCVVAAVRSATVGMPIEASATAPFTDGRWLLSHNGVVDRGVLPVSADAESTCDSAVLAALIFTRGLGVLGQSAGGVAPAPQNARWTLLAASVSRLLATTWGDTLAILRRDDGVVIASEPYDDQPGWEDVPDRHLVEVTTDQVTLTALNSTKGN